MGQPPVIDATNLLAAPAELATLDRACREWGFFYVVGHGVDAELVAALHAQMHAFFALPPEEKNGVVRTDRNVWGYYDRELTKNVRDLKEIYDVGPLAIDGPLAGAAPQWPAAPRGFAGTLTAFMDASRALAHRLLAAVGINLGATAADLGNGFLPEDSSFLRLNYYPLQTMAAVGAEPRPDLGINRHTDAGALTVLSQDAQPGLQVLSDGQWRLVEPLPGALLINIGDIVQVWSNDRYPAPLHRVLASRAAPRYSAAFFFNPAYSTDYAPLPSLCDAERPPRYSPINWGAFRAGRAAGDYADRGEEIQIAHFRC